MYYIVRRLQGNRDNIAHKITEFKFRPLSVRELLGIELLLDRNGCFYICRFAKPTSNLTKASQMQVLAFI